MVSLIPCLWHRWHECPRGVMGDIAYTSWWGGEDIYYILCHIVPLFYTIIVLSQLQDSVSLTQCLCHRWHGCHRGVIGDITYIYIAYIYIYIYMYVMLGGEDIDYMHTVPYCQHVTYGTNMALMTPACNLWHQHVTYGTNMAHMTPTWHLWHQHVTYGTNMALMAPAWHLWHQHGTYGTNI